MTTAGRCGFIPTPGRGRRFGRRPWRGWRLAAGERLAAITADPAMPSAGTIRYWRAMYGGFAGEVFRLTQVKAGMKVERLRARRRPYDAAVGERIYVRLWKGEGTLREILRSEPGFPSLAVLARWRREEPGFDRMLRMVFGGWRVKRRRDRTLCTAEMTEAIVDGLLEGETLRSLSRRPGMPSQRAMSNWVRTRSHFAAAVELAREARADWCVFQMLDVDAG